MTEELYHIQVNGIEKGPLRKESLLAEGLTPNSMVWRPGLDRWMEASALPELSDLFIPYGNPYRTQHNPYSQFGSPYNQQPQNPYYPYNQNIRPETFPPGWTNWLGWAIAATILGFFCYFILCIPGIIGIVKANEANTMAKTGDPRALAVNATAKTWTLVGLILSGVFILGIILILFLFGAVILGFAGAASGY